MKRASALLVILGLGCGAKSPPPNEPKDVAVAKVDGGAELQTTPSPDAGEPAKPSEPPIDAGWITTDYKSGRTDYVGREKALAAIKQGTTRVLVRITTIVEECSSMGGTHVFVEPAFAKESPFSKAHLGGHGVRLVHAKGSLFGDDKQLFVASVETHPPSSFGNGRGWCLEKAPPYDADVLAIIPVRSEGEGMRLLTELAK